MQQPTKAELWTEINELRENLDTAREQCAVKDSIIYNQLEELETNQTHIEWLTERAENATTVGIACFLAIVVIIIIQVIL